MTPAKFILALYVLYEWALWVPSGWIAVLVIYSLYRLYRKDGSWQQHLIG